MSRVTNYSLVGLTVASSGRVGGPGQILKRVRSPAPSSRRRGPTRACQRRARSGTSSGPSTRLRLHAAEVAHGRAPKCRSRGVPDRAASITRGVARAVRMSLPEVARSWAWRLGRSIAAVASAGDITSLSKSSAGAAGPPAVLFLGAVANRRSARVRAHRPAGRNCHHEQGGSQASAHPVDDRGPAWLRSTRRPCLPGKPGNPQAGRRPAPPSGWTAVNAPAGPPSPRHRPASCDSGTGDLRRPRWNPGPLGGQPRGRTDSVSALRSGPRRRKDAGFGVVRCPATICDTCIASRARARFDRASTSTASSPFGDARRGSRSQWVHAGTLRDDARHCGLERNGL